MVAVVLVEAQLLIHTPIFLILLHQLRQGFELKFALNVGTDVLAHRWGGLK